MAYDPHEKNEDRLVPTPMIPMYLGSQCELVVAAIFRTGLSKDVYSSYPVLCRLKGRNTFFTLSKVTKREKVNSDLTDTGDWSDIVKFKLGKCGIENYNVLRYEDYDPNATTPTVYCLGDDLSISPRVGSVLKRNGLSAFYATNCEKRIYGDIFPTRIDIPDSKNIFAPIAYSSQMVSEMMSDDDDIDIFNSVALLCLKSEIPGEWNSRMMNTLKHRLLFFKSVLPRPPEWKKTLKLQKPAIRLTDKKQKIGTVKANQWVFLYCGVRRSGMMAVIGNPESPLLSVLNNEQHDYKIQCGFVDHEAVLMSPTGGDVYIVHNGDGDMGFVDMYIE